MIKVNGVEIKREHFPDGSQRLLNVDVNKIIKNVGNEKYETFTFDWRYECDEELVTMIYTVNHLRDVLVPSRLCKFCLNMFYMPNARMDRIKSVNEVFTLKHFCKIINDLKFDHVTIFDPHSNVCTSLLNDISTLQCTKHVEKVIEMIDKSYLDKGYDFTEFLYYFPDAGAAKKYSELLKGKYIYGEKKRDWNTGQIQGLEIKWDKNQHIDIENSVIIMVDDIISYGGSLYYSVQELKKFVPKKIYAYVSHTENSILDNEKGKFIKLLEDGTVEKLFTTDSIFTGEHEKIEVLKL